VIPWSIGPGALLAPMALGAWIWPGFGEEPGAGNGRALEELAAFLEAARRQGAISDSDAGMLAAALRLARVDARQVMVPREQVVAVPVRSTPAEIEEAWLHSGHRQLPVYQGSLDRVVGYVHAPELYGGEPASWHRPIPRELVHPVLRVRRSRRLVHVLEDMRRSGTSFGVVTGARGVTAGILTLHDVLGELLVGEGFPGVA
jgi:putative hemolysin